MPVTIEPSAEKVGVNTDDIANSSESLCKHCELRKYPMSKFAEGVSFKVPTKPAMHTSFRDLDDGTTPKVIPYANGFVKSFYVVRNAEELRNKFVAHDGKKTLEMRAGSSSGHIDVAVMARKFTCLVEEHLVDKEIRNWIIPDFTTTTDKDIAVASITIMATMQAYFEYNARTGCGFPSVTLLGERSEKFR